MTSPSRSSTLEQNWAYYQKRCAEDPDFAAWCEQTRDATHAEALREDIMRDVMRRWRAGGDARASMSLSELRREREMDAHDREMDAHEESERIRYEAPTRGGV